MELDWIWKSIIIVLGGTLLLRVAGRKSISQMTLAQTVIMIGIGSLLIQPLAGRSIWTTLGVGTVLVITLIIMEYAQIKSDRIESFITGKSQIIIKNGVLMEKNLKKLRFTVDQLEMKLRQQNITAIEHVKYATLEPNGQIGYQLKEDFQPVTKQDFDALQNDVRQLIQLFQNGTGEQAQSPPATGPSIFTEIEKKAHVQTPPEHLQ